MKISPDGRIAYHSIRFIENGTDLVQYDFDGSVENVVPRTRYNVEEELLKRRAKIPFWQRLTYGP